MSGKATVAAFTINRQTWIPGFEPPYVVAMVELDDEPDVRLITNVVGVPVEDVRVGMAVEVFFEDWTSTSGDEDSRVWLPLFRPAQSGTESEALSGATDRRRRKRSSCAAWSARRPGHAPSVRTAGPRAITPRMPA